MDELSVAARTLVFKPSVLADASWLGFFPLTSSHFAWWGEAKRGACQGGPGGVGTRRGGGEVAGRAWGVVE